MCGFVPIFTVVHLYLFDRLLIASRVGAWQQTRTKQMTESIQIQIKSVYGTETAYPVCAKAKAFAAIAGTKTITRHTLLQVMAIGFSIEVLDRYGRCGMIFDPAGTNQTRGSQLIHCLA
jgi:hypothetical protein